MSEKFTIIKIVDKETYAEEEYHLKYLAYKHKLIEPQKMAIGIEGILSEIGKYWYYSALICLQNASFALSCFKDRIPLTKRKYKYTKRQHEKTLQETQKFLEYAENLKNFDITYKTTLYLDDDGDEVIEIEGNDNQVYEELLKIAEQQRRKYRKQKQAVSVS